jgi:hypothetical protein
MCTTVHNQWELTYPKVLPGYILAITYGLYKWGHIIEGTFSQGDKISQKKCSGTVYTRTDRHITTLVRVK